MSLYFSTGIEKSITQNVRRVESYHLEEDTLCIALLVYISRYIQLQGIAKQGHMHAVGDFDYIYSFMLLLYIRMILDVPLCGSSLHFQPFMSNKA